MLISLIAAASENDVIGKGGTLPWKLPADWRYFREKTMGKPVIMGRKTYQSIGHPLPDRHNIVISRDEAFQAEGCDTAHSLEEALTLAENDGAKEAMILGGGEIYRLALPLAHRIYLTRVHVVIQGGDTFFPEVGEEWQEVWRERHEKDPEHLYAFTMIVFERKPTSESP